MSRLIVPKTPWLLGLAGLIPFAALAVGAWLAPAPFGAVSVTGFYLYAAVILSFLGGARWGFELAARPEFPSPAVLVFSNLPALVAWLGVMLQLTQPVAGLGLLAGGLAFMWVWDGLSAGPGQRQLPLWYPALRSVLTLVVLACCGAVWWITTR
jgi:hypothetical protein